MRKFISVLLSCVITTLVFSTSTIAQTSSDAGARSLKHKIAIGRFTNETRYGKTLLRDQDLDPLGKQAADILAAYLTNSDRFLVFERPDIIKIEREKALEGEGSGLVNVDALILGSVVEFGTTVDGKRGLFNKKAVQRAHAKVAIRVVDVRTGLVFHSATGAGEATTASRTILGIGSVSGYDGTLTDKAISVAIENLIDDLVGTISDRPWHSALLHVEDGQAFIAGGPSQGLSVGDVLYVQESGKTVKNPQTGFEITLPGKTIAEVQVVSFFGETETSEGAIARLVSGALPETITDKITVTDKR